MAMIDRFPFEEIPIYLPSDCCLSTELSYLAAVAGRLGLLKAANFLNKHASEEPCRCHVDDDNYSKCVLDQGRRQDCSEAKHLKRKEDCPYWRK